MINLLCSHHPTTLEGAHEWIVLCSALMHSFPHSTLIVSYLSIQVVLSFFFRPLLGKFDSFQILTRDTKAQIQGGGVQFTIRHGLWERG